MKSKDRYYKNVDGQWTHQSPIKLLVNPILRKIQFYTDRPFVIASVTEFVNKKPRFVKYAIRRVLKK